MPESPEELERLDRERIIALLKREQDAQRRKLLEQALREPEKRDMLLEMYFHGGRHSG
jgi:hypothetical protein